MSTNTTGNNINVSSIASSNQTHNYFNISDILNTVSVVVAAVGVGLGCFVVNIVRKLDDNDLRSRFSLLSVLICDVILASSNLTEIIFVLTLIDRKTFEDYECIFIYVNLILSSIFSVPLALSLLCLAADQVIAVFKPLYFRTSDGLSRKFMYSVVTFVPVFLTSAILIYWTLEVTGHSADCVVLLTATSDFVQYVVAFIVPVAASTPMIYAVVLWKISRQRSVHSENPVENIQNRRLVVTFLFISASYFLLWMPTLVYFSVCYYGGEGCWQKDTVDVSLVVHTLFIMNYIVDPVTCAVRMEPIKQRILQIFRAH